MQTFFSRWHRGWLVVALVALAFVVAVPLASAAAPSAQAQPQHHNTFRFKLVHTPPTAKTNIGACLPHARGRAEIERGPLNDELTLHVDGLAPNTGYDLFVIELPTAPFGISWYQSDLETNHEGEGEVSVRGIFNVETFSVSTGGTTTFAPTHQYHLGLWFNDPNVPFKLGCEPGATTPIVTPFNGEQHAGIQVLNTSNFPDSAGPLSHVAG